MKLDFVITVKQIKAFSIFNLQCSKRINASKLLIAAAQFYSPVQVKNYVSVYRDRESDIDSVGDRDKNNR